MDSYYSIQDSQKHYEKEQIVPAVPSEGQFYGVIYALDEESLIHYKNILLLLLLLIIILIVRCAIKHLISMLPRVFAIDDHINFINKYFQTLHR